MSILFFADTAAEFHEKMVYNFVTYVYGMVDYFLGRVLLPLKHNIFQSAPVAVFKHL